MFPNQFQDRRCTFVKGEITHATCMLVGIIYTGKLELTHQHPSQPSGFKPKSLSILQLICPTVTEEQCEVCWWSFLYTVQDHKPFVQGRECWLVSEPGELPLRKLLENTSGREQVHEAEAVLLETEWVSNLPPCLWSSHWCCKKAVINTSGRK